MITLPCSTCGTKNDVPESMRGKQTECSFCFARLRVPVEEGGVPVDIPGYTVMEPLGAGATGRVFKARQESMERLVALKVIPRHNMQRPESSKRFTNEVRMLAKLDHPNIIAAYDSGETEGFFYLAMSYVDGESIDGLIARRGYLAEDEALSVAYQVAHALHYAWDKQQLLHRDIKPSNIMISRDGEVKLMDLGISKTIGRDRRSTVTATGMVVGTPYYMSPEQAVSSQSMDPRSDIYSLGATLYEMVTGTKPFQGDNPLEVMGHHRFTPLPPARNRNRKVSEACELLLEVMMAKDKGERYAGWQELMADISQVMNGNLPDHERPADAPPRPKGNTAPTQPRLQPIAAAKGKPKSSKPNVKADGSGKRRRVVADRTPRTLGPAQEEPSRFPLVFAALLLVGGLVALGVWFAQQQSAQTPPDAPTASDASAPPSPPPQVPESPPDSAASPAARQQAEQVAQWQQRFDEAVAFRRQNPEAFREARQHLEWLLPGVPSEKDRRRLQRQLDQLEKAETAARAELMRGLRREAQQELNRENYHEAVAVYLEYQGPLAMVTQERREEQAQELIRRQRTERLAAALTATRYHDLLQRVAFLIVNNKLPEAINLHVQGVDKLGLAGLEESRLNGQLLTGLQQTEQQLLASFESTIGQEQPVALADGTTIQYIVQEVQPEVLVGLKVERRGESVVRLKRPLTVAELAPAERARRLGRDEQPEHLLSRGLLALEAKRYDVAHRLFGQVDAPLAVALQGFTLAAAGESGDQAAAQALQRVMAELDVLPELSTPALVRGVWDSQAEPDDTLARVADRLRIGYGPTSFLKQRQAVLDALRQAYIFRPAVAIGGTDDAALRRALREIVRLNPGTDQKKLGMGQMTGGFFVSLGGQESIEDITPLLGLPIDVLDLSGSAVRDLEALRGMPLTSLDLRETPVQDLAPLRGLPLRELDLTRTSVAQLAPLAGLPLRELHLQGCENLQDLTALAACTSLVELTVPDLALAEQLVQSLPRLRRMGIAKDQLQELAPAAEDEAEEPGEEPAEDDQPAAEEPADGQAGDLDISAETRQQVEAALARLKVDNPDQREWLYTYEAADGDGTIHLVLAGNRHLRDLSALADLPLSRLVLDGTAVADLAPLQGLPLTHLSLAETEIDSVTGLRGLGLTSLSISDTAVEELFPLFSMKLETLDISGTQVRDLEALEQMPLTALIAHGTPIRDLAVLHRKRLTVLDLAQTEVRDFSVLDDLRRLETLKLSDTRFDDLDLLENKALQVLHLDGTRIDSLDVLAFMPLVELQLHGCDRIRDLTPLMSCQNLERLSLPSGADPEPLRKHPALQSVHTGDHPDWEQSAEAFWERH